MLASPPPTTLKFDFDELHSGSNLFGTVGDTSNSLIVIAEKPQALLVPARAVRDGKVWLVEGDRARAAPVRLGIEGSDKVEIRSGLASGACLLADPPDKLKDGARVKVSGC